MNGGAGNDILTGGSGVDTFLGGAGDDAVDGNQADDVAFLGLGNDSFTWDSGDGSDKVEGEPGRDRLIFHGSAANDNISVVADGPRLVILRDVGSTVTTTAGVETVDVNPLTGNDSVFVHSLAGTAAQEVNVNLAAVLGGATGDAQHDNVELIGTGLNDTVTVTASAGTVTATGLPALVRIGAAEATDDLFVLASGGNDKVTAGTLAAGVMRLSLNGGIGNDTIFGSQGNDMLFGLTGNDFVFGDDGDDLIFGGFGNDTFQWDPGDDNDTLEGQDGTDRMLFNGNNTAENIDIAANGGRVRFFRNVASVTMDLDNVERVDFNAKGGADTVVVHDLAGTDLKEVRVDLAAAPPAIAGDGAPDKVIVEGTNGRDSIAVATIAGQTWVTGLAAKVIVSDAESQVDEVAVNGLVGNDTLSALALAVTGPLLTLDGGDGDDTMTGSAGDDVLLGGNGNDRLVGLAGDDLIDGGAGDDSVAGGAGDDILNGGDGTDTIDGGPGDDVAANGETVINV
jgi:Ca2+-binding RTX toxin-like protein